MVSGTDIWGPRIEIAHTAVDNVRQQPCAQSHGATGRRADGPTAYDQLGSQISMFQVTGEIGTPVRIGYSQAKLVNTSAT